jgi:hypothetical protein
MLGLKVAKKLPKCVECVWEDGLQAKFSFLWLRDNSNRRPSLVHLDLNARPEAVDYSRDGLNILWPPFSASRYSSDFLRENALGLAPEASPDNSGETHSSTSSLSLNGGIWSLGTAAAPLADEHVLGQCEWKTPAQEPGTVWPHLQPVPSMCAVDVLSGPTAKVTVVDTGRALALLAAHSVRQFEFLAQCKLPYREGPFRSRHPLCSIQEGQIIPGVFNNTSRSSAIPVEAAEELYECLQKFGRICADIAQTVHIHPGQRLIVDNSRAMLGAPAQSGRHVLLRLLT